MIPDTHAVTGQVARRGLRMVLRAFLRGDDAASESGNGSRFGTKSAVVGDPSPELPPPPARSSVVR